jgi:hypothetical protein
MENRAMKASPSRVRASLIAVAVGTAVLFSAGTRSLGDDIPFVQKENGPFMVLAKVFRGVDAEESAKALATELRREHKLPAYLLRVDARGVARIDEVAVLVGDAKTPRECESILKQVRAISPRCLANRPVPWQRGLAFAVRTTNPLAPPSSLIKRR